MVKVLWDVLSEYQILTKLGYFTMDNASNNDAMLSALECRLQEEGIEWDSTSHRLRCSGHIIQLAVGDFLFGRHPDLSDSDEGRTATLEHVLPSMDFLLQHFEDAKTTAIEDNDPIMVACIETGWAKLDHYYNLADRSPVYIAAIVLNSKWKFEYFTGIWTSGWIEDAKQQLRAFWQERYQSKGVSTEMVTTAITPTPRNAYQAWINSKLAPVDCVDEYSRYLTDPTLLHIVDALPWWVQQRCQYPAVCAMEGESSTPPRSMNSPALQELKEEDTLVLYR
jgi:hypothetical protein